MAAIPDFFRAIDYGSPAANGVLAFSCAWLGYYLSVKWNERKIEEGRIADRESLFKSIEFFLCDCTQSIKEGTQILSKSRPPHHPLPSYSLDYFLIKLMRHREEKLIVHIAALQFGISQANTLIPNMINMFTTNPTDATAQGVQPTSLQLYCAETLKRFEDVGSKCIEIADEIQKARNEDRG